jgi:very-short-patch-repair endonuclease
MKYDNLNDSQKLQFLQEQYEDNKKSFQEIASMCETYANKLRRDAIKYKIKIRDKSEAQKNALNLGKTQHPTKGKERPESIKEKIGLSVLQSWEKLDSSELNKRKDKARDNWVSMSDDEKERILKLANDAVRESSKHGSKLEKHILKKLMKDGYQVEFHKEQNLANTKLQIDLFLPKMNVAIEVDGPSHFEPVWGNETLSKNKAYDNKKNGLILGKGLVLIRIKQTKDYSKARGDLIYRELKDHLNKIEIEFPASDYRTINIGDN